MESQSSEFNPGSRITSKVHPLQSSSMENRNNNGFHQNGGAGNDNHGFEGPERKRRSSETHPELTATRSAEHPSTSSRNHNGFRTWGPRSGNAHGIDGVPVIRRRVKRMNLKDLAQLVGDEGAKRLEPHLTHRKSLYPPEESSGDDDEDVSPSRLSHSHSVRMQSLDASGRHKTTTVTREFARETFNRDQLLRPHKELSGYKKWQYDQTLQWQRQKRRIKEAFANLELWHSSFKEIEGHSGPSVLSFFRFVKWLFLLNVMSTIVILGIIILPQAFMEPNSFPLTLGNQGNQSLTSFEQTALTCSSVYSTNISEEVATQGVIDQILDFFQGTGWMENTYVFMGYYYNKTFVFEEYQAHYNMPLAFLLSLVGYMLVSLIVMVAYTAHGSKEKLVNSSDKFYRYCNKVFCGWDYGLSTDKGSKLKQNQLHLEYKFDIEEAKRSELRSQRSTKAKVKLFFLRVIINIVVLVILCVVGFLIYEVISVWMPGLLRRDAVRNNAFLRLLVQYLPSMTMTLLNAVVPLIFLQLVIPEDYTPANEIKITISRTVFMRLATIAMYAITIALNVMDCDMSLPDNQCGCDPYLCWETYMGQQFFKLAVTDLFVVIGLTFFMELPRRLIVNKFPENKLFKWVGQPEFDIVINVLDIVYAQTITWIGGFFCPIIPMISVVRFFITFYLKKLTLFKNCVPQPRQNTTSKTTYFFMIILLVAFALCSFAISYAVGRMPPSTGCGPFRVFSTTDFYMYMSVTDAISTLPSVARQFFNVIGTFLFFIIVVIIICLAIYYHMAVVSGHKRMAQLLRQQLALEGQDKQFLLKRVNEILQG